MHEENIYTIKKGDTFWDLEIEWGIPHGTLQELNPNAKPKELQIGQKIQIVMPTLVFFLAEEIPDEPLTCRSINSDLKKRSSKSRMDEIFHQPNKQKSFGPFNSNFGEKFRNQSSSVQSVMQGLNIGKEIIGLEDIRRRKLLKSNELWHFQKNGTVTHPWKKMSNGASHWKNNLVRHHRSTFQSSAKAKAIFPSAMSYAGRFLLAADIGLTGEIKPSHVVNAVFLGASATGVGVIFSGVYFIADIGTKIISGRSIGERLDGWVENNYGRLKLYEGVY